MASMDLQEMALKYAADFTHVCNTHLGKVLGDYHLKVQMLELIAIDQEWKVELGGQWWKFRGFVINTETKKELKFIKEFNALILKETTLSDVEELVNDMAGDIVGYFFKEEIESGKRVIFKSDGVEV